MINHSFVLDALESTAEDTFRHFEELIDEHRARSMDDPPSRLKQLVPTVNIFHTRLPLRRAFLAYNKKYVLTKRKHITISFNELRHILNLAQILALRGDDDDNIELKNSLKQWEKSPGILRPAFLSPSSTISPLSLGQPAAASSSSQGASSPPSSDKSEKNDIKYYYKGAKMITFDGDQTLYSDGANFDKNPELANYLYLLLRNGVTIAVVTAAGYEYATEKYELRLSGLLAYFKQKNLPAADCERFYLFGGECNYLLVVSGFNQYIVYSY